MTDAIVSQAAAELVETGTVSADVSQAAAELVETGTVSAVASQYVAEVCTQIPTSAIVSQAALELVTALTLGAVSQYVAELVSSVYTSRLRWKIEAELDGDGNGWTDISGDVRAQDGITCQYGIVGSDPSDRVGSTGTLRFSLNNGAGNSGGVLGYYSPFNATACRPGFGYNIRVRFWLNYLTDLRYKHHGRLADIVPVPGSYAERLTRCQSLDWMDDAARIDVPDLSAQTSKRVDQLLTTILDAMTTQPAAREFGTGLSTFAYALDGGTGQQQKVREELQKLAMSEQGYIFIKGDATQGGTLAFQERGARSSLTTTHLAFNDDMARDGLVMLGGRDDVYKTVQVIVHPTEVEGSTSVLFSLQTTSTLVKAGETISTIFGPYRNASTNEQCGGTGMIAPAATTDYTMNTAEDGSGADLTGSFTVTASFTGQGVRFTAITNGSGSDGYITKLQVRGYAVNRSDAMVEKSVAGSYGDRVLTLDLPYQSNVRTADKIATYLATLLASPVARVRSVKFLANRSDAFMAAAITREPGDRVSITETVTGLSADLFVIQNVKLDLQAPDILWCTWGLQPYGLDAWWAPSTFEATGGTITEAGGYTIHTFTSNGTFEIVSGPDTSIEYLIVGGGGGGGGDDLNSSGGGGGGGGEVTSGAFTIGVGTYSVVVGAGGAGGSAHGSNGSASSVHAVSAAGGSGGGGGGTDGTSGTIGGGGGADDSTNVGAGGVGTLFSGGGGGSNGGGGGGGAAGAGGGAPGFNVGGAGGAGVTSSISGSALGYGGGGSGAAYTTPGAASHGGGTGATFAGAGGAGTANRGGGGGGGRFGNGGAGGAGVVILRYPTPE